MSPDQINAQHRAPVWKCWTCKAESNLEWWNGLSVAVCYGNQKCRKGYSDFLVDQAAAEEAYQAHIRENYTGADD
jgi:hypothetical protein